MSDVTQLLAEIESGNPLAANQLLPLVYAELRQLAAVKLAHEKRGQTLQATDLVHAAYVRLVDVEQTQSWDGRQHFFAAAAEAMRRILVEAARRKTRQKHGGGVTRVELADDDCVTMTSPEQVLAIDEMLSRLEAEDAVAAAVLKLRYFAGMSVQEAATSLHIHRATAHRHWTYARAWIRAELQSEGP